MELILLEKVANLGNLGDKVKVKAGYGRNFLLPQGKALRASQANIKAFEERKVQLEARNLETKKEAEDFAAKLDGQQFIVIRNMPTPGSPAFQARQLRLEKKGKLPKPEQGAIAVEAEIDQKGQRTQPVGKTRAKKTTPKKK